MKTLLFAVALMLAAAFSGAPAAATDPAAPGSAAVPPVRQTPANEVVGAAVPSSRYEWRYRYVGRHNGHEGNWVLVH
ncbi:MAG: hypothetical protein ACREDY_00695 [Bradyrhizobium sp.]